jgi:glutamate carboxypeptidase
MRRLLHAAESHRVWTEQVIEDLVRLESPSTDKLALDRCGAELARLLAELGGRLTVFPQHRTGDHLRAEFGRGESQVLLLGHFDTVWPVGQLERMPLRRDPERLWGPGSYDMKAGIAIAMTAVRVLLESGERLPHRIVMLCTSDEEIGSHSSRALIESEAARSRAVLVLEPTLPGGGVKTSRKGVGDFRLAARGTAAHAGIEPERGASAIHELAWQTLQILELQDRAAGLTVNVGRIEGGSRCNVVAASAVMEIDVRIPTMADADRVTKHLASLSPRDRRVELTLTGGIDRPPMERTAAGAALYERAKAIAETLGRVLPEGQSGGGSDGNFTAALGVPTIDGLGADGGGAHALDEHVLLEPLAFRAALVAGLLLRVQ